MSMLWHDMLFVTPLEEQFQDHSSKAPFPVFKLTQAEILFQLCVLVIFPAAKKPSFPQKELWKRAWISITAPATLPNSSPQK